MKGKTFSDEHRSNLSYSVKNGKSHNRTDLGHEIRYCACGCGSLLLKSRTESQKQFEKIRYLKGHSLRGKHNPRYDRGYVAWNKGKQAPQISKSKIGHKVTDETKRKLSIGLKGKTPWNKGKYGLQKAWNKGTKGIVKPNSGTFKKGIIPWNKGKTGVYSDDTLRQMREHLKGRKSWNKGKTGIYSEKTIELMSKRKKGVPYTEVHLQAWAQAQKKTETKPELKVKNVLNELGLSSSFKFQEPIFGSVVDFLSYNLRQIIEVQGCFYHFCPICYSRESIAVSEIQYKRIQKDKKLRETAKKHGYEILEIWEHELKDTSNIKQKILDAIEIRKAELNLNAKEEIVKLPRRV